MDSDFSLLGKYMTEGKRTQLMTFTMYEFVFDNGRSVKAALTPMQYAGFKRSKNFKRVISKNIVATLQIKIRI